MAEKKVSVNIFEVVYTAANKLLAGGHGLGIVAATKSMPNDFEKTLSVLRSYTFPQLLKDKLSGKIGERFIFMPITHKEVEYLTFSRLSDSTSPPYLSRTTIIAHHLATPVKELKSGKMNAGDLVAWAGGLQGYDSKFDFIKGWDADPEELNPTAFFRNTQNPLSAENLLKEMGIENNLQSKLKDALAGVANRLFDFDETKKTAVLIIPYDWQTYVPRLLTIILFLLPNGIQNYLVAVSQVWDKADLNFDAGLVFTYPDAPYIATMQSGHNKNKVEIFDLAKLQSIASNTGLSPPIDKIYKQYALEYWNFEKPDHINLIPIIFNHLDPICVRKDDVFALKRSIDDLYAKYSDEKLTISEKLGGVIEKLKVFQSDVPVRNSLVKYLNIFVNYAVKNVLENLKFKERCDALLEIWKYVEIIALKPDEITKVLESNYKAIFDNFEDILKNSSSAFAGACINVNRNLEIVKIFENRKVPLGSILEAIEIEVFNSRRVNENITRKNEISNFEKYLLDVASNWFVLGPSIITPAWNRIKKGGREKDNPCYFSKAIINLQLDHYLAAVKVVETNL